MKTLLRNNSIFGLHFDFHANESSSNIGASTNEKTIQEIIDISHPDFLQCDCKGHRGISSYPTSVGTPADSIEKDILKIWRDVTTRNNVALYVHYSGLFDIKATEIHPEWAVVNQDGSLNSNATNLFCSYADTLMIPQIFELIEKYNIDGIWIDGDCWDVLHDYSTQMKERFMKETGCEKLPVMPNDLYFDKYLDILRQAFREYILHYTKEIHKRYPNFQIASNWAYTSYMPESVTADVDFLSGDCYGCDCVNVLRYEAKYMQQQKIHWDLMSWNVARVLAKKGDPTGTSFYSCDKSSVQLEQEASIVLAHGGGFQIYYSQERDGGVDLKKIRTAAPLSQYCRERKKYCFHLESKAEIAVFYSGYAARRCDIEAFGFLSGKIDFLRGILCLSDSIGMPINFVSEHHLDSDIGKYSLIIIPEWKELNNIPKLLEYVWNGGKLLIIGCDATRLFKNELGVQYVMDNRESNVYLDSSDLLTSLGTSTQCAEVEAKNSSVLDYYYEEHTRNSKKHIAASIKTYGKGKIAGIYFNMGNAFRKYQSSGTVKFFRSVIDSLLPEKFVEVIGSNNVEVTISKYQNGFAIGLINLCGPHSNPQVLSFDEIPKIPELTVKMRCKQVESVVRQPGNINLSFTYQNGYLETKVTDIEIYDILVVRFKHQNF